MDLAVEIVVGALSGLVLFPFAVKIVLGLIGFSAIGPVAGSIAAGIQALIGNVAAGSLFAGLQSLAMGGAGVVTGVVGAVIGAIGAFLFEFILVLHSSPSPHCVIALCKLQETLV